MSIRSRISLSISFISILVFLYIKLSIFFDLITETKLTKILEFVFFLIFFFIIIIEYLKKTKAQKEYNRYSDSLNKTIIKQSHNQFFYDGNLDDGGKELIKEAATSLKADRCSIWLYDLEKKGIICDYLYIKKDDEFQRGTRIEESDFPEYFNELKTNSVIVADDSLTHRITKCFNESYSFPLGIKSMLDVPIVYKGDVIGVICIENLTPRKWIECEINFSQLISSLYSFSYSVAENNIVSKDLIEIEKFIDFATLISKTDSGGKITYVNKKFTKVSGYSLEEVLGKDHNIVNSGYHPKSFWKSMYKKVINEKKIWNSVVTNKNKNGDIYYVDTYIKADYDQETSELKGFTSIRQDVTEIVKSINELDKKNTYLEHAAKILRHDMHSGINTYIPRGISSLERRLTPEIIKEYKLEIPLRILKEGLTHTQKIYKGVYSFTNLVKKDSLLEKESCNIRKILKDFLDSTSYSSQVAISDWLPTLDVNESLFCTAIDNLIRNGLKYNDSDTKIVAIYMEDDDSLVVQDNGRGMSQNEFELLSRPYSRKKDQKEEGTGLGLNICVAILNEHGFSMSCEKLEEGGTKIKIKIK